MTRVGARHGRRNLLRDVPEVSALAEDLKRVVVPVLGAGAFAVRGIFFDKLPDANWEVNWHQDLSIPVAERIEVPGFNGWSIKQGVPHVQPPARILERMVTVRVHLDDCGTDNGPLRIVSGSHRGGRLDDASTEQWIRDGEQVTCLVPKGGALLMRPLLLHASSRAEKPLHRRVIHLEYASDELPGGLRWFEKGEGSI
jgi:ectoine hydroxylase-related dioxygenase (phytanoyl-CoA dioxygenase family)